jgi:hypothetical protein
MALPHYKVETPVFMPVGTKGTVKGLTTEQLQELDCHIILGNTYHLGNHPGHELVAEMGGLHGFINWPRGMLTDRWAARDGGGGWCEGGGSTGVPTCGRGAVGSPQAATPSARPVPCSPPKTRTPQHLPSPATCDPRSGGFQMVSLLHLADITEEGVEFQSPVDGSRMLLTPEESMAIQNGLGADIIMQVGAARGRVGWGRGGVVRGAARLTGWAGWGLARPSGPELRPQPAPPPPALPFPPPQLDDVVPAVNVDAARFEEATYRTTRWLDRCIKAHSRPNEQARGRARAAPRMRRRPPRLPRSGVAQTPQTPSSYPCMPPPLPLPRRACSPSCRAALTCACATSAWSSSWRATAPATPSAASRAARARTCSGASSRSAPRGCRRGSRAT